ncbi:MAG: type IV secretory system conjugative DNA transfer family protein [Pseudomonadota bacterium]
MAPSFGRPLGLTFAGKPIFDPYPTTLRLVLGATGAAKTTSVVVPTLQALIGDLGTALVVADVKEGEIAAQIAPVAEAHGRPFAICDDFGVLGPHPARAHLNPFGAMVETAQSQPQDLVFAADIAMHALIPEPEEGDAKNRYFRQTPRSEIECAAGILLARDPHLTTPGAVSRLMGDPELWTTYRQLAAEEGAPALRAKAQQSLAMEQHDPEHYSMHHREALTALRIYEPGTALHNAGRVATLTHRQVIEGGYLFCIVLPQLYAQQAAAHLSLHLQGLMEATLRAGPHRALFLIDEMCNAPLKEIVARVTIQRSYGAAALYIAQSRSDIVAKYGKRMAATLEENCPIQQYLSFTRFEEAEQVSRAMGEVRSVSQNLTIDSARAAFGDAYNLGKERMFTPEELMALPRDEQIIHIQGLGYLHCRKLFQNQIAPTCYDLGPNPLEGAALPPDPKVWLQAKPRGRR